MGSPLAIFALRENGLVASGMGWGLPEISEETNLTGRLHVAGYSGVTGRLNCSIKARMSSTRQALVRGPSLTGFGKRPEATPDHQLDRETGMNPSGPMIDLSRTKPVSGSFFKSDKNASVVRRGVCASGYSACGWFQPMVS